MSEMDKKWIKPLIIAVVIGYAAGKIIYELTGLAGLTSGAIGTLREFFIPLAMVIALLVILYLHNREHTS